KKENEWDMGLAAGASGFYFCVFVFRLLLFAFRVSWLRLNFALRSRFRCFNRFRLALPGCRLGNRHALLAVDDLSRTRAETLRCRQHAFRPAVASRGPYLLPP